MKIPLSACTYYGRLFLEAYEAAGGRAPAMYITSRLEQSITTAAQAAAKPELECCCEFYATNSRFTAMVLKFRCPVHGEVELDRRIMVFPISTGTITTPYTPPTPYQPVSYPPCPVPNTIPVGPDITTTDGGNFGGTRSELGNVQYFNAETVHDVSVDRGPGC